MTQQCLNISKDTHSRALCRNCISQMYRGTEWRERERERERLKGITGIINDIYIRFRIWQFFVLPHNLVHINLTLHLNINHDWLEFQQRKFFATQEIFSLLYKKSSKSFFFNNLFCMFLRKCSVGMYPFPRLPLPDSVSLYILPLIFFYIQAHIKNAPISKKIKNENSKYLRVTELFFKEIVEKKFDFQLMSTDYKKYTRGSKVVAERLQDKPANKTLYLPTHFLFYYYPSTIFNITKLLLNRIQYFLVDCGIDFKNFFAYLRYLYFCIFLKTKQTQNYLFSSFYF